MKDLKGRTVRGSFVTLIGQTAKVFLRIGSLVLLARLLTPEDFGLVAMVTAITGVLEVVKDVGLSTATVQRAAITEEQISTLFWINLFVGMILALLLVAMAPVFVSFYHEPRLLLVTVVLAFGFLFGAAVVQHQALLQRQMRFIALVVIDIISLAISIVVGIGMAIGGCGYWALVGMAISSPAANAVCVWLATGWIPGIPRRNVGVRSMVRFGGTVTLNMLVVYVTYNFDKVLLGRFWGAEALGIYGRAYQLINFPSGILTSATWTVAFPVLSRLQDDPYRFKNYFLKGYSLLLGLTLPITMACALFADDLIFVLLGPKWLDVVPIFRLLAPTILVFSLINPLGWLLFSTGLQARSLKIALALFPLIIGAYIVGLPYGPTGIAITFSVAMMLWLLPCLAWSVHGTVISLRDLFLVASRPFLAGIVAATLSYGLQFSMGQVFSPFPRLVLESVLLLGSYLWILLFVMGQKSFYLDILQSLRGRSSMDGKEVVAG